MPTHFQTKLASLLTVIALAGRFHPIGAAEPMPKANLDDYQKSVALLPDARGDGQGRSIEAKAHPSRIVGACCGSTPEHIRKLER